jgi:hypothetical protein
MQYATTNLSSVPSIRAHLRVHARFVLRLQLLTLANPSPWIKSPLPHPRS